MSQFMTIANIKGNVTNKGFEGAMLVHDAQHINNRFIAQKPGTSTTEMGIVNTQHIQILKDEDAASAQLFQAFYKGTVIPKVDITRCSLLAGKAEWQSKITLTNVIISSIEQHASQHSGRETLTLSFNKIERSFRSQNSSGAWQTPKRTSYDISTTEVA